MSNLELNEDTQISLDYTNILQIFSATKMLKSVGVLTITNWALEIEEVLENKLTKNA